MEEKEFSTGRVEWRAVSALLAALGAATVSVPVTHEPRLERQAIAASSDAQTTSALRGPFSRNPLAKKDPASDPASSERERAVPETRLLATLVQLHTDERVALDLEGPPLDRFRSLLADRVTGSSHAMDPRLLGLLRALAGRHPGARIELVSGFRSPKLNEMLRKKGHNVASHSQHSLGHAVDFRIVLPNETKGLHPRAMEKEIRALNWDGGVGVYASSGDWFVHADVGRNRHWGG